MLRCVAADVNGRNVILSAPLSVTVKISESVPADAFYGVFELQDTDELSRITLYAEEKAVFSGVVDETERLISGSGAYLRITARGMAALLLDNEAAPCCYDHPSASFIAQRYAEPYGIRSGDADDTIFFGEQSVIKGASCWSVIRRFCALCFSAIPRVGADGALYMKGMQTDAEVRFGAGGVPYTQLSEVHKRCEEISAVYLKTDAAGSYDFPLENSEAVRRGIRRDRYLNAVLTESPMQCAEAILQNGAAKAYTVRLRCPGCLLGIEGRRALIADGALRETGALYVSALQYRMGADGEYTDVTLKRRSN